MKGISELKIYISKCCSCFIDDIDKNTYIDINKETCIEINGDTIINFENFEKLVEYMIELYRDLGILDAKKNYKKFFILGRRFTWKKINLLNVSDIEKNINKLDWKSIYEIFNNKDKYSSSTVLLYVKYLIWYFRKIIVDFLLYNIIKDTKIKAFSSGSTKIDSDYDITLNGNNKIVSNTIYIFNNIIMEVFNEHTDILFDTNLYGLSFINSTKSKFDSEEYKCGNNIFYIDKINGGRNKIDFKIMQNIWGLIQVIKTLNEVQSYDTMMYKILYENMINNSGFSLYSDILSKAIEFCENNMPETNKYSFILEDVSKFNKDSLEYMNYISYINYNGLETYLTRGAFIDVVINGQMCKSDTVKLDISDYYDCFIENSIYLISHYNKSKYITRFDNSFDKFQKILSQKYADIYSENIKLLRNIKNDINNLKNLQKSCASSTLECSRLLISDYSIKNIFNLTYVYLQIYNIEDITSGINRFDIEYKKFPNLNKMLIINTESSEIIQQISPRREKLPLG